MKWEPIETAPKNEPILIHWSAELGFDGITEIAMLAEWVECGEWGVSKTGASVQTEWIGVTDNHSGFGYEPPTHWMALPDPPE